MHSNSMICNLAKVAMTLAALTKAQTINRPPVGNNNLNISEIDFQLFGFCLGMSP